MHLVQNKETKERSSGHTPFNIETKMVTKTASPKKHFLAKKNISKLKKDTFILDNFSVRTLESKRKCP